MVEKSDNSGAKVGRGEFDAVIIGHRRCGPEHAVLWLEVTNHAMQFVGDSVPGQFVQVACREFGNAGLGMPLLPRPFSIAAVATDAGKLPDNVEPRSPAGKAVYLQLIYRVIGVGTSWLAERVVGQVVNILGPLGSGFEMPVNVQTPCILVGGGVGLPPLFFLADRLAAAGYGNVVAFAGAQNRELFPCEIRSAAEGATDNPLEAQLAVDEFTRSGTAAVVATDDGSRGFCGTVVDALNSYLDAHGGIADAQIYACGPMPMLKAVARLAHDRNLACQVCMEAYMACGKAVCQSCAVAVRSVSGEISGYKLVCSHGPVFQADEIAW